MDDEVGRYYNPVDECEKRNQGNRGDGGSSLGIFYYGQVWRRSPPPPPRAPRAFVLGSRRTVPDIPRSLFKDNASLKGSVVTVSDGDSIRVRIILPQTPPAGKSADRKNSRSTNNYYYYYYYY